MTYIYTNIGGLPEWLNGLVLKTSVLERVPGVRIPEPPQKNIWNFENCFLYLYKK
jgi:hypothetical protein